MSATEATLGYRLRQYHVGLVCWAGEATTAVDNITRLEHATSHVAEKIAGPGEPLFIPRDESSAWAWLALGIRDRFDVAGAAAADEDGDLHFAFGDAARGVTGFRLTHQQALAAQSVALAAGQAGTQVVTFGEVAPVAMMLGSPTCCAPGCWPPWPAGHRRRASQKAARHPADVPAHRGQLQSDGRATGRCTRTPCSTGSAGPRRAWAAPPPATATTSSWPSGSPTGSAQPSCNPRRPLLRALGSVRPGAAP